MLPIPPIVFATPEVDIRAGNDIRGIVIDGARWDNERIIEYSVIFSRESTYDVNTGRVDVEATGLLLANNSLHYRRTADMERFLLLYDEEMHDPIGIGFGSLGSPQSWIHGNGKPLPIPSWVPVLGGRQLITYEDDIPLTPLIDPRVVSRNGTNMLPWSALEVSPADATKRRLYVSTPNHLFDYVNRNQQMLHVEQRFGDRRFQQVIQLPAREFATAEDVARQYPDESNSSVRDTVRTIAQTLFHRDWLF